MRLVLIIIIMGVSDFIFAQEIYYISPIDARSSFEGDGFYFPNHDIKIENGICIYNKAKFLFKIPFGKIYRNHYEIFEDISKHQFIIVTTILKEKDDYPGVNSIPREHIYIISLDQPNKVYYTNLKGIRIVTRMGYNLNEESKERSGNLIEAINIDNNKIIIMRHEYRKKAYFEEFNIYELEK